ncbi:hypothetical protein [Streptomyces tendae]|uniref:hypothetical protein n=1 Tax=Streptomyces tendae TaxID=1932 RepID=UPI002492A1E8|nr:hypothetical protein [Streptomyces tendae]
MSALFLILLVALIGLGFLDPLFWVAAAVVVYGITRSRPDRGSRDRGGGSEPRDYRDYRDYREHRNRQERWDRRYYRQNRARRRNQARRDRDYRG